MPRFARIALVIVILTALPFLLDLPGTTLLSHFGCDVGEGNLSDCAIENGIDLLLIGLSILKLLSIITLPLGYLALLALGGFWLATRRLSHSWWPVVVMAEAGLVGLGIWVVFFI